MGFIPHIAFAAGLIKGRTANHFAPEGMVTRVNYALYPDVVSRSRIKPLNPIFK